MSSYITSEYDKKRYNNIIDNLEINGRLYFDNIQDFLKMFIDAINMKMKKM
jgi:hypothetical protein